MNRLMGYQTQARRGLRRCVAVSLFALSALLGALTSLHAQTLTWLGTLGGNSSAAYDVSLDGRVVVGEATSPAGWRRAFRWTAQTGMQDMGTLGGLESIAYGISETGDVIVGWAVDALAGRPFRWTPATGMTSIGTFGGCCGESLDVSAQGSVAVGWSTDNLWRDRAFRWQQSTSIMEDLGTFGGRSSTARAVAADGSVVVGEASDGAGRRFAFRWQDGNMQNLGVLDGYESIAHGVSADGNVVVGEITFREEDDDDYDGSIFSAFRWQNNQMQQLSPSISRAYAASGDGSIVVGFATGQGSYVYAFLWTPQGGLQDLNQLYANLVGANELRAAHAISRDGRYIVGVGYNWMRQRREAFLLDRGAATVEGDVNGDGCVDDADLLIVLFNFGNAGGQGDANNDNIVDDADLLLVLFNFGEGC